LIVGEDDCWSSKGSNQLRKEVADPDNLTSGMSKSNILSLGGGESGDGLLLGAPADGTSIERDLNPRSGEAKLELLKPIKPSLV
jgi:hypothetical protein